MGWVERRWDVAAAIASQEAAADPPSWKGEGPEAAVTVLLGVEGGCRAIRAGPGG